MALRTLLLLVFFCGNARAEARFGVAAGLAIPTSGYPPNADPGVTLDACGGYRWMAGRLGVAPEMTVGWTRFEQPFPGGSNALHMVRAIPGVRLDIEVAPAFVIYGEVGAGAVYEAVSSGLPSPFNEEAPSYLAFALSTRVGLEWWLGPFVALGPVVGLESRIGQPFSHWSGFGTALLLGARISVATPIR